MIEDIAKRGARFVYQYTDSEKRQEIEMYEYGIYRMLSVAIGVTLIWLLGVLTGYFLESIFFTVMFGIARQYMGGYHAPTTTLCKIIYSSLFLFAVLICNYKIGNNQVLWGFLLLGSVLVLRVAPVRTKENPVIENRKVVKKKAIVINVLQIAVLIILGMYAENFVFWGQYAILCSEVLLGIGWLKYKEEKE